jgi:hypothetical protein
MAITVTIATPLTLRATIIKNGTAFTPDTLTLEIKRGKTLIETHSIDDLTFKSAGVYEYVYVVSTSGDYSYRYSCTGSAIGSAIGTFTGIVDNF